MSHATTNLHNATPEEQRALVNFSAALRSMLSPGDAAELHAHTAMHYLTPSNRKWRESLQRKSDVMKGFLLCKPC